jgi:hypothetical protein
VNKKWAPYILIGLLAIILLGTRLLKYSGKGAQENQKGHTISRERGFDRRISYLEYSAHALCRMNCRQISKPEVEQIMQTGTINYRKSDIKNARCPRYALEGTTRDDQRVRIVFAQCNEKTEVVTAIDLGTEWECHCPGDDN